MKNKLLVLSGLLAAVSGLSAQGLVAGWDFAGVPNLVGTNVNGYAAEKTAFNNGFTTSGSISTTLTQGTQVTFNALGSSAIDPQDGDGFDVSADAVFDGAGQTAIEFFNTGGSFDIVFNFTSSTDVVVNFDWLTETTGTFTDIMNVSYSTDGVNFTSYTKAGSTAAGGFGVTGSSAGWGHSTGNSGGATGFLYSQADQVIDLTAVVDPVQAVRFEFVNLGASERIGLDNVHVAGTAVPEPSAFAAIAGVLALGFVAVRRRK